MKYVGWGILGSFVAIAWLLGALPARADILPCAVSTSGITCPPPVSCNDDAECFGQGLGRCVRTGSGSTGICSTDCNSIFGCNSDSDCPTFDPLVASCQSIGGGAGICTYHDTSDRPFVTLCTSSGGSSAAQLRDCFVGGSWNQGDCDRDGILNGVDADPCSASVRGTVEPVPSPFCLRGHVCEGTSTTCAPFLRCSSGTDCANVELRIGTLNPWECTALPAAPAITFCHPSCDATLHCSTTGDCGLLGTCRPVGSTLSMCLPPALTSCANGCSTNPLNWATGQGDCDGDGAQNGCDPSPCTAGDTPCLYNHICSIDGGVLIPDASVNVGDASVPADSGADAFVTEEDASTTDADLPDSGDVAIDAGRTRRDSGSTAMDGSAGTDASNGLGFGGGGGCRCALVGARASSSISSLALSALLTLVIAARRRQRVIRR